MLKRGGEIDMDDFFVRDELFAEIGVHVAFYEVVNGIVGGDYLVGVGGGVDDGISRCFADDGSCADGGGRPESGRVGVAGRICIVGGDFANKRDSANSDSVPSDNIANDGDVVGAVKTHAGGRAMNKIGEST